jgi:haloalkane dehalogenase
LFIDAEPAELLICAQRDFCRRWPNQEVVTVQGSHFLRENAPEEVGKATDGAFHREGSSPASRAADITR